MDPNPMSCQCQSGSTPEVSQSALLIEQAKIFKALGHPTRLMMAQALCARSLCVSELCELTDSSLSTVSAHLTALRAAGIVQSEKAGTAVICSLRLTCLKTFLACSAEHIRSQKNQ